MYQCSCSCGTCTKKSLVPIQDESGITICRECFDAGHTCACVVPNRTNRIRIAVIANDTMKQECTKFGFLEVKRLSKFDIYATNGTWSILDSIKTQTGIPLTLYKIGHAQTGDRTAAHMVDRKLFAAVLFFIDPYDKHHDDEKRSLLNACLSTGTILATTVDSASWILKNLCGEKIKPINAI